VSVTLNNFRQTAHLHVFNLLQPSSFPHKSPQGTPASSPTGERDRQLRIWYFVGLSLLIHVLLLVATLRQHSENVNTSSRATSGPLTVHLIHPVPATPPPTASAASHPKSRRPAVMTLPKTVPRHPPIVVAPIVEPEARPDATPMDMSTMLNAARERRRVTEEAVARDNAEVATNGREPSADEIAMSNIKRNLQRASGKRDSTSGIFQILHKGTRTAQFAFRGWTPGLRNDWHETIDVDAGLNGDVEHAIVRKIIELIRKHYSGNFNWESRRLGKVIVLSARPDDNTELEAFMMREFFES
jgi:hypothetical protein